MEIPYGFKCPITLELMIDPYVTTNGQTYEKSAILTHLKYKKTCPKTNLYLDETMLQPNYALRSAIEEFKMKSNTTPKSDLKSDLKIDLPTITTNIKNNKVVTTIHAPVGKIRCGVDSIEIIDVSGSMSKLLDDNSSQKESSLGHTRLDIVKHAVKAKISVTNEQDRLCIIAFNHTHTVILPLTQMNEVGRKKAYACLAKLIPDGMTNIWGSLSKGLDILKTESSINRNPTINLFTDGLPSKEYRPPSGEIVLLNRYKEKCGGRLPATINTIGFGYNMDSQLLKNLAINGQFAFIPEKSMLATILISLVANNYTIYGNNVILQLQTTDGVSIKQEDFVADSPITFADWGANINLKNLYLDQNVHFAYSLNISKEAKPPFILTTLKMDNPCLNKEIAIQGDFSLEDSNVNVYYLKQLYIQAVYRSMQYAKERNYVQARLNLNNILLLLQSFPKHEVITAILHDLIEENKEGQVVLAVNKDNYIQMGKTLFTIISSST